MGTTLREVIFDIGGGHAARPAVQGRAAGRALGRLPARLAARRAHRLREPAGRRLHDGLRRHGGGRRHHLHGRLRQVLPQVHRRGELRQVRALPGRLHPHARDPRTHLRGLADRRTTSICWRRWPTTWPRARSAPWAAARPTRSSPPCATSETRSWPTSRSTAARPRSAGRSSATSIDDEACTGCRACARPARRGPSPGSERGPCHRPEAVHQVRRLPPGLQVRRRPGRHGSTRAGRKEAEMSDRQDRRPPQRHGDRDRRHR